jgi:hypothetical protein
MGHRPGDVVHPGGQFTGDRHGRVLRLEAAGHHRCQFRVSSQERHLGPPPFELSAGLGCGGRVPSTATVAVDLGTDRAPVPTQPVTDLAVGLVPFDPGPDLFPFKRAQRMSWHAGLASTGQKLRV